MPTPGQLHQGGPSAVRSRPAWCPLARPLRPRGPSAAGRCAEGKQEESTALTRVSGNRADRAKVPPHRFHNLGPRGPDANYTMDRYHATTDGRVRRGPGRPGRESLRVLSGRSLCGRGCGCGACHRACRLPSIVPCGLADRARPDRAAACRTPASTVPARRRASSRCECQRWIFFSNEGEEREAAHLRRG